MRKYNAFNILINIGEKLIIKMKIQPADTKHHFQHHETKGNFMFHNIIYAHYNIYCNLIVYLIFSITKSSNTNATSTFSNITRA